MRLVSLTCRQIFPRADYVSRLNTNSCFKAAVLRLCQTHTIQGELLRGSFNVTDYRKVDQHDV